MQTYSLSCSVDAVQYVQGQNAGTVGAFVKGKSQMSWNNNMGDLHFYNDGADIIVKDSEWAVRVGSSILVLSNDEFLAAFAPLPSTALIEQPWTTQHGIEEIADVHARLDKWLTSTKEDGRTEVTVNTTRDRFEVRVTLDH